MNWFINTLSWWQWAIMAAIPPAIVALYFLKLRRQPLEVPSTFLWQRTIEDLHVNSLWQRLRRSILLLLQLLVMLLVMLVLLRPGWHSQGMTGNRFVILIDNSASMSSKDVKPTRLDEAKLKAKEIITGMNAGDAVMIIAFNDRAVPIQQFTSNKHELNRKLASIRPTNRTSDISEALRLAAGLANPGRFGDPDNPEDVATAQAQPAELHILTDGRFGRVDGFDFGNLRPNYLIIGGESPRNVGITSFNVARNEERPDQMQAICRIENFGKEPVSTVSVSIYLNDEKTVRDAAEITLTDGVGGYPFDLVDMESGTLKIVLEHDDDFADDNVAYAAINVPRRAKVLIVSPGNDALILASETLQAQKAAEISTIGPDFLKTEAYAKQAESAAFDLIVYDQCAPAEKMPNSNTLFIGSLPPGTKQAEIVDPAAPSEDETDAGETQTPEDDGANDKPNNVRRRGKWLVGPLQPAPMIIDTDRAHPLMRYVELGNVRIAEAVPLTPPPGGAKLVEADIGPIFAIAPRRSFEDAVLGFELVGENEKNERYANTDWTIRRSFPLFVMNVLRYLGGQGAAMSTISVKPGHAIELRTESPVERISITSPEGQRTRVERHGQATFAYGKTDQMGVYNVFEGDAKQPTQRFAVNLFDTDESNILPRKQITVGQAVVDGQRQWQPMRRELWKWILIGGLGLLLAEWWIWNRRVYL